MIKEAEMIPEWKDICIAGIYQSSEMADLMR